MKAVSVVLPSRVVFQCPVEQRYIENYAFLATERHFVESSEVDYGVLGVALIPANQAVLMEQVTHIALSFESALRSERMSKRR